MGSEHRLHADGVQPITLEVCITCERTTDAVDVLAAIRAMLATAQVAQREEAPPPEPPSPPAGQDYPDTHAVAPARYMVRTIEGKVMVGTPYADEAQAITACQPGQEVVDGAVGGVIHAVPAPPRSNQAEAIKTPDAPLETAAQAKRDAVEPVPKRSAPVAAAAVKMEAAGLDPAEALAYYDRMSGGEAPDPGKGAAAEDGSAHYEVGARYDGVEIVRVQTSRKQGFGVLTLQDGTKVKYDLATGHEVERKNRPPAPEGAEAGEISPTTRQSGPGAPKVDQPLADTTGVPEGETPEWMKPIVNAKGLKAAVTAALARVSRDDLVEWALANRGRVPAFARVKADTFRKRIERQLATIPKEAA